MATVYDSENGVPFARVRSAMPQWTFFLGFSTKPECMRYVRSNWLQTICTAQFPCFLPVCSLKIFFISANSSLFPPPILPILLTSHSATSARSRSHVFDTNFLLSPPSLPLAYLLATLDRYISLNPPTLSIFCRSLFCPASAP